MKRLLGLVTAFVVGFLSAGLPVGAASSGSPAGPLPNQGNKCGDGTIDGVYWLQCRWMYQDTGPPQHTLAGKGDLYQSPSGGTITIYYVHLLRQLTTNPCSQDPSCIVVAANDVLASTTGNYLARGTATYTYPCGYYYFSQVKWKLVTATDATVGPRIDNSYRFHPC